MTAPIPATGAPAPRARAIPCLALLVLAVAVPAAAQRPEMPPVAYPAIAARAERPADFVPEGWRLEHLARGHLDTDDVEDAVLLLRMDDARNVVDNAGLGPDEFDTNPRMLVAAFAEPGGGFRRALADHALIPRPENPVLDDVLDSDPAEAVRIDSARRSLSVRLHSWASAGTWFTRNVVFTFRHQDGCFRLIGYDDSELHRASLETREASANYLTGRAWTREGSAEKDEPGPKRWTRFDASEPVCLERIGDGFAFRSAAAAD